MENKPAQNIQDTFLGCATAQPFAFAAQSGRHLASWHDLVSPRRDEPLDYQLKPMNPDTLQLYRIESGLCTGIPPLSRIL